MKSSKQIHKEEFEKTVENYQLRELEETCKTIAGSESLFNELGLTCLNYVLNTNRMTCKKKLEWINTIYQPCMTNETTKQRVLSFMLSLRYEQQDLMDVELYQLLIATFQLRTLTCKQKLEFAFSDAFNGYIVYVHNSTHRRKFAADVLFIENQFEELIWDIPTQTYQLMPDIHFDTYEAFDTVLKECVYLLGTCHPSYIPTITFALIQLFEYAKTHYSTEVKVKSVRKKKV
ncbi:hypothetical protein EDC96DRAFT_540994 [Choanephora cucurbitarum]|nr:hypothetical protein EDC96DRAFT_540994 [Choanephora cucurbitarum]